MGVAFICLNRHILRPRTGLLKSPMGDVAVRRTLRFAALGLIPYFLATVLAFVSPYITIAIVAACAIYYSFPIASRVGDGSQSDAGIA